ncbi:MAG: hypothetical protein R3E84_12195 [Pseudomonadales bacterium]
MDRRKEKFAQQDAEKVHPGLVSAVVGFADSRQMQRFPLHFRASRPWLAYQAAFSAACNQPITFCRQAPDSTP